ncbi:ureidoglycolate lyase [Bradyrhizobium sp. 83002]|uniref:ureidoglycolate lyase n=1 Tax=Bradyrhizobium aeschynomenes TaxID=2734909 RepID=UPI0015568723|nr:ureidoglycolate lyase [Bradyrhizobium aeschynomenes]NPU10384.1 ureidoglycolate lyase [Bradyrhizobium aeschynomenes]
MRTLTPQPLTKAAFAPFGDVVETDGAESIEINQGFARRCNGLAAIDVTSGGIPVNISLFEAKPRPRPIAIKLMERHPLGTQLFMPLQDRPWLVLVCTDPRDATSYRAFTATGRQGVNYARNVWHHPLLVFDEASRFMVVDRMSPDNLEELWLDQPLFLNIP